jgi:hypothetical protein
MESLTSCVINKAIIAFKLKNDEWKIGILLTYFPPLTINNSTIYSQYTIKTDNIIYTNNDINKYVVLFNGK